MRTHSPRSAWAGHARAIWLCAACVVAAQACAQRSAVTTWGYSHWYQRPGVGSLGAFERQQAACLREIGASEDPAAVEPYGPQEKAFLACMNRAKWCTQAYQCGHPGY